MLNYKVAEALDSCGDLDTLNTSFRILSAAVMSDG